MKTKEIVVISGKGGTGKTSVTAAFAMLAGSGAVISDCDVDAANLHLLMNPMELFKENFYSGQHAEIAQSKCTKCEKCREICRFNAIYTDAPVFGIDTAACEGCAYCSYICPENAITMRDNLAGKIYFTNTRFKSKFIYAHLEIGAENSGKLVTKVRQEAARFAEMQAAPFIITDGSPGIGCPVIASLTGAHFAVVVTEPSLSGFHDLKRVYELTAGFNIPGGCIINKSTMNESITGKIEEYLKENNIPLISKIPYDDIFTTALSEGKILTEYREKPVSSILTESWNKITQLINQN